MSISERHGSLHVAMACMIVFLASDALSQTFYGSIVGTVTDSSNAIVEGATVTLVNTGTSERRSIETSGEGAYRFVNLIPGNYRL